MKIIYSILISILASLTTACGGGDSAEVTGYRLNKMEISDLTTGKLDIRRSGLCLTFYSPWVARSVGWGEE